ncbi:MAG TPA: dihydrolipoamide acetyltransferase family protein [Myxococcales bacterium]|jgi:2-oxoglutarate dehydrogenase E2 component (dihydrolipoamide succinyltransferase)
MTTVVMPQLGESVVEGTVVRWIAQPGQRVSRDEPLLEIATDKANTEIPSPSDGVLAEQLVKEGAVVAVGAALASLDESGAAAAPKPAPAKAAPPPLQNGDEVRASPVGRNVAQEHGVDLNKVAGSGTGGRVTKADVIHYLEKGATAAQQSELQPPLSTFPGQKAPTSPPPQWSQPPVAPVYSQPPPQALSQYPGSGPIAISLRAYKPPRYSAKEGDQTVPFDQRRRLIAEHMVYSKATSPHVPCTAEVDMTALSRLRGEWKKAKETSGKAPSFLVGICRATVQALSEFPRLNAVVQDESLILRRDVNLGVAVETEKGLLVPVIRRANELSVLGLARALDDLALRSRTGKVTADELSGGSFTVSNPGLKGNLFGAAIINQPQVGILRMGEIVKRAVVREVDGQDAIVVRQMMYLTLSYDHRVIDGVTGNSFLHRVRELIEEAKFAL